MKSQFADRLGPGGAARAAPGGRVGAGSDGGVGADRHPPRGPAVGLRSRPAAAADQHGKGWEHGLGGSEVIRLDATLIAASSAKEQAAGSYKGGWVPPVDLDSSPGGFVSLRRRVTRPGRIRLSKPESGAQGGHPTGEA